MRLFVVCALVSILLLDIGCGGDTPKPSTAGAGDSAIVAHLDSLNVTYQVDENGIYYYPITLNPTGKTQLDGTILSIYYTLDVLGGQNLITYDSADGDPIRLKRGANAIYPIGIDLSLAYMNQGEEWVFIIPSSLAYPEYTSDLIPENSILQFRATLEEIQNENDILFEDNQKLLVYSDSVMLADTVTNPLDQPIILSNGMIYKRLAAGGGTMQPDSGSLLTITYRLSLPYQEANPIDLQYASNANPFIFTHRANLVLTGLDAGIARMNSGDRSLLVVPSLLGYRESAIVLPQYLTQDMADLGIIPSYATKVGPYEVLIFDVQLLEIN
ncbi:MAG: FKBP-type peptidyl-prolyl cis-trans isomerase [Cyclobacteriaceae bacterium]